MAGPSATPIIDIRQAVMDNARIPQVKQSMQSISLEDTSHLFFTRFPELPYELRRDIWLYAHPAPRNVILATRSFRHKLDDAPPLSSVDIRSPFAHLLTNHEARTLFIENYPRLFKKYPCLDTENKGWYFNQRKDTLGLDSGLDGLRSLLKTCFEDLETVRYLDIHPGSESAYSRWFEDSNVRLSDIPVKFITLRHFPGQIHHWTLFKENTLVLRKLLQHEHKSTCEEGKCTRLAVQLDYDIQLWGRQTFCKIHDEGEMDHHTCVDLAFLAYNLDPEPSGAWMKSNATGFDVHLPERSEDGTFPTGTREIDLHMWTASDWSIVPIRENGMSELSSN